MLSCRCAPRFSKGPSKPNNESQLREPPPLPLPSIPSQQEQQQQQQQQLNTQEAPCQLSLNAVVHHHTPAKQENQEPAANGSSSQAFAAEPSCCNFPGTGSPTQPQQPHHAGDFPAKPFPQIPPQSQPPTDAGKSIDSCTPPAPPTSNGPLPQQPPVSAAEHHNKESQEAAQQQGEGLPWQQQQQQQHRHRFPSAAPGWATRPLYNSYIESAAAAAIQAASAKRRKANDSISGSSPSHLAAPLQPQQLLQSKPAIK